MGDSSWNCTHHSSWRLLCLAWQHRTIICVCVINVVINVVHITCTTATQVGLYEATVDAGSVLAAHHWRVTTRSDLQNETSIMENQFMRSSYTLPGNRDSTANTVSISTCHQRIVSATALVILIYTYIWIMPVVCFSVESVLLQ